MSGSASPGVSTQNSTLRNYYRHEPIDLHRREIRLITIIPGRWRDFIDCRLSTVCLDENPYFEALLYCWGDPKVVQPILIDGHFYDVTVNLHAALRRLRLPYRDRCLWIDAICINQVDDIEKNYQVQLMKDIYLNAKQGIIWLGDTDEEPLESCLISGDASVKDSDRLAARTHENWERGSSSFTVKLSSHVNVVKAFSVIRQLSANRHIFYRGGAIAGAISYYDNPLLDLMNQPWWNRIWTVQEAILPRSTKVFFGSIHAPWYLFTVAAQNIANHMNKRCCHMVGLEAGQESGIHKLWDKVNSIDYQRTHSQPLALLLHDFRDRSATDPLDRIFGLLGLAQNDVIQVGLYPDYGRNVEEVYQEVVYKLIKHTRDLAPLLRPSEAARCLHLPSWVSDFTAPMTEVVNEDRTRIAMYRQYNASRGLKGVVYNMEAGSILELSGALVDEILDLGNPILRPNRRVAKEVAAEWTSLLSSRRYHSQPYPAGGTYEEAMWQLQTRGLVRDVSVDDYRRAAAGDYRLYLETLRKHASDVLDRSNIYGQKMFITRRGYIGLSVPEMQVGDSVFVLLGGRVPFILRTAVEESDGALITKAERFQYVGDVYVQGFMYGEALEGVDEKQLDYIFLV